MESEENQLQVFPPFPPPLEIAFRPDFHISTVAPTIRRRRAQLRTSPPRSPCFLHRPESPSDSALFRYPHQTARRPSGSSLFAVGRIAGQNSPARGESAYLAPKSAVELTGCGKRAKPNPGFHSRPTALGNRPKTRFPRSHRRDGNAAAPPDPTLPTPNSGEANCPTDLQNHWLLLRWWMYHQVI